MASPSLLKVLVAGASGLVGSAAVRAFLEEGWQVVGLSRRRPDIGKALWLSLDLRDRAACEIVADDLHDVTHVVYAALLEQDNLVAGWTAEEQMQQNAQLFRNLMEPLKAKALNLRHVTLMQGMKAYGAHLGPIVVPARERMPRHPHPNFYWLQEDALRELQADGDGSFTILRPQVVFGQACGAAMNLLAAIGVYAAVQRLRGELLYRPEGARWVLEATDAELLGRACVWAASSPACAGETFNIHNGEAFEWEGVWPSICAALGLPPGPPRPVSFVDHARTWQPLWESLVQRHGLVSPPRLENFVGSSFQFADRCFGFGESTERAPMLASVLKARAAGFDDFVDTEEMFSRWIGRYQDSRWLPPPDTSNQGLRAS